MKNDGKFDIFFFLADFNINRFEVLAKASYTSYIVIFHFTSIVPFPSVLHTSSIQIECILSNKPNSMTLYESNGCSCGKLENTKKICIKAIEKNIETTHPLSTDSHKAPSHRRLHLIECHILIHHIESTAFVEHI